MNRYLISLFLTLTTCLTAQAQDYHHDCEQSWAERYPYWDSPHSYETYPIDTTYHPPHSHTYIVYENTPVYVYENTYVPPDPMSVYEANRLIQQSWADYYEARRLYYQQKREARYEKYNRRRQFTIEKSRQAWQERDVHIPRAELTDFGREMQKMIEESDAEKR